MSSGALQDSWMGGGMGQKLGTTLADLPLRLEWSDWFCGLGAYEIWFRHFMTSLDVTWKCDRHAEGFGQSCLQLLQVHSWLRHVIGRLSGTAEHKQNIRPIHACVDLTCQGAPVQNHLPEYEWLDRAGRTNFSLVTISKSISNRCKGPQSSMFGASKMSAGVTGSSIFTLYKPACSNVNEESNSCNILQQQNGVKLALDPEQLFFPGLRWCCAFASFACRKSGNCGPLGHFHTVAGLGASFRLGPGRLDTLHFPSKTQWLKMGVSINGGYP